MIDQEDEYLTSVAIPINDIIQRYAGMPLTREVVSDLQGTLNECVRMLRVQGVKTMPDLTPIVIVSTGYVMVVRRDLEGPGLQNVIRNLIALNPTASAAEVAVAVRDAFPSYRPVAQ